MELYNKSSQILDYEQSDECIGFQWHMSSPFLSSITVKLNLSASRMVPGTK